MKCGEPKISILMIQPNSSFEILGSNILSSPGIQLYTYTNTTFNHSEVTIVIPSYSDTFPQLTLYGMIPYRYISIRSTTTDGPILLSKLTFPFLNINCENEEHCNL